MTVVTIDLDSLGSMIGGLITVCVGLYTFLNQKGYIKKWKTKLSISDDVAKAAKKQNGSALIKLSIPDELIAVFKDIAADSEGGIDAQRIIDILNDRNDIEKILGSDKPLTREEKDQIHCIMIRAMQSYRKSNATPVQVKKEVSAKPHAPKTTKTKTVEAGSNHSD